MFRTYTETMRGRLEAPNAARAFQFVVSVSLPQVEAPRSATAIEHIGRDIAQLHDVVASSYP